MLELDGLLIDLKGVPCPRQKCLSSTQEGYLSNTKTLGKRCHSDQHAPDKKLKTVWHRCDSCTIRQHVGLHNPIFAGFIGPGSNGISYAVLAFWNCVEGVAQSVTVRQLNTSEVKAFAGLTMTGRR